jgi:hypothetical protein
VERRSLVLTWRRKRHSRFYPWALISYCYLCSIANFTVIRLNVLPAIRIIRDVIFLSCHQEEYLYAPNECDDCAKRLIIQIDARDESPQ